MFNQTDTSDPKVALGLSLACSSYANHVEVEAAPESSAFTTKSISPRATHPGRGLTFIPLQGLNVWSMVYHDTLVITLNCLERLEKCLIGAQKLIMQNRTPSMYGLNPHAPDWISGIGDGKENDDLGQHDYVKKRHFSDPIGSAFWKKLEL